MKRIKYFTLALLVICTTNVFATNTSAVINTTTKSIVTEAEKVVSSLPTNTSTISNVTNLVNDPNVVNNSSFKPYNTDFFGQNKDEHPIFCVDVDPNDEKRYKHLALTFDTGASMDQTLLILDILDAYNIKSTFFLTYNTVKTAPNLVAEIINRGHEVANHSTSHPDFKKLSKEKMLKELRTTHNFIKENFNIEMSLFRFPYGSYNAEITKIIKEAGYYPIQWSLDTLDWKQDGVDNIVARTCIDSKIHSGAIILCHNGPIFTPYALPSIINYINERGYKFSKVSDLIYDHNFYIDGAGKQHIKTTN